jgi:hypothetical protein
MLLASRTGGRVGGDIHWELDGKLIADIYWVLMPCMISATHEGFCVILTKLYIKHYYLHLINKETGWEMFNNLSELTH